MNDSCWYNNVIQSAVVNGFVFVVDELLAVSVFYVVSTRIKELCSFEYWQVWEGTVILDFIGRAYHQDQSPESIYWMLISTAAIQVCYFTQTTPTPATHELHASSKRRKTRRWLRSKQNKMPFDRRSRKRIE